MKVRRREFIGVVGGALASVSTPTVNAAARAPEVSLQAARPAPTVEKSYTVSGGGIAVEISSQGKISGVTLTGKKIHRALQGHTALAECELNGEVTSVKLPNAGVEFRKPLSFQRGFRGAILVERFLPTAESVRWEIEIQGGSTRSPWPPFSDTEPWGTAIETHLKWPEAKSAKFWTSWGDNFSSKIIEKMDSSGMGWTDPIVPQPFREMQLWYGGYFISGMGFSVPIATIIEGTNDSGVSLALSPEDTLVDLSLDTDGEGSITFSRLDNKISKERPVRFAMDLVAHEGDWRPGLGWMVKRYPDYFNPANPTADEVGGGGAYSAFTGDLDADKFKKMAYRVNWLASFDWPYVGMYLPPVPEGTEWTSWYNKTTSTRKIDDYCRRMREMGFYVLCYFNISEFGTKIKFPPPASTITNESDLWKDPNAFLYNRLGTSILYGEDGKPIWSWYDEVAVDPGDSAFHNFIVDLAARHVKEIPNCSGICIDRMDRLMRFNHRADDGVTWLNVGVGHFEGRPARSLVNSWKETLSKIGPIMHNAGKAIYGNTHYKRLDVMRDVDGIFDEHGFLGFNLNQDSFIAVLKPVIAWTNDKTQLQPDPDAFFQRHLFMGAFPMVPYPENDHSILPDEWAERYYTDYGPLMDELRGRKWVLTPHVIEVEHSAAKANIFQTPRGFAVPVTFGGKAARVAVIVRGLPPVASPQDYRIEAILPGSSEWKAVKFRKVAGGLAITVPLSRGCAMVRLVRT
jgi:hypothetical protein